MHKISRMLTGIFAATLMATSTAPAFAGPNGLLGVQVGYPDISFTSNAGQGASYDGVTLTVTSAPVFTTFVAGGAAEFTSSGNLTITASIDSAGNLSGGTFTLSGTVTNSINSTTYSGVLLTGTVVDYGMSDIAGPGGTDLSDFKLQPTGGQMLSLFGTGPAGAIISLEGSTYAGNFAAPFGATRAKGDLGPIPTVPPTSCNTITTATIGYWKNHPTAWPVTSLVLGGVTFSQADAISILKRSPRGDKSIIMAQQLIAAKLNVAAGACHDCVDATITAADAWLTSHGGVASGVTSWDNGEELHETLEDYNEGELCAAHS